MSDLAHPELRIGDAERRACDEQLNAAVGAGLLTLEEYETRVGALWSARTAGELAALVRDLPTARPWGSSPVPAQPGRHRHRRRAIGLIVAAVIGVAVFTDNDRAPLAGLGKGTNVGNRTLFAPDDGTSLNVPRGTGNVVVVIPDGFRADINGVVDVTGNVTCQEACARQAEQTVRVVSDGHRLGNIMIRTRQEAGLPPGK